MKNPEGALEDNLSNGESTPEENERLAAKLKKILFGPITGQIEAELDAMERERDNRAKFNIFREVLRIILSKDNESITPHDLEKIWKMWESLKKTGLVLDVDGVMNLKVLCEGIINKNSREEVAGVLSQIIMESTFMIGE